MRQRAFQSISLIVVILGALASIGFSLWILRKGIPYSDEAYYVLLAKYPASVLGSVGAPQWIAGFFWHVTDNLWSFRLSGALLLVTGSMLLTASLVKSLRAEIEFSRADLLLMCSVALLGALSYGAIINFSPSYNLMSSAFGYINAAIALRLCHSKKSTLWFALGITLAISMVVKPTSGVAIAILTLGFVHPYMGLRYRNVIKVGYGFLATSLGLVLLNSTPKAALQLQFLGNDLYRDVVSTSLRSMVTRYSNDLSGVSLSIFFEYPVTVICLFLYYRLKKQWLALPAVFVLLLS